MLKKKLIAFVLIFQNIFSIKGYANPQYDNYDFEQFMRNAKDIVHKEKNLYVPIAIFSQYSQSLEIKNDYISKVYKQYVTSVENLEKSIIDFSSLYKTISVNNINTLDDYRNYITKVNNVSKHELRIRNNIYSYRKSEKDLLDLKDFMKDYCTNTSKLENTNALTFEPQNFVLSNIDFIRLQDSFDSSIHNKDGRNGDISRAFFTIVASGVIIGAAVSMAGETGYGLTIIGIAVAAAYITAFIMNSNKEEEERRKYEEFIRKVESKFKEAKEWYKNNSIVYNQNEIRNLAYNVCTTNQFSHIFENVSKAKNEPFIPIKDTVLRLENNLSFYLNKAMTFNENITYSQDTNEHLLNLFSINSGVMPENALKKYNHRIIKKYEEINSALGYLEKNTYQIKDKLAKKLFKKDMDIFHAKLQSDLKVIEFQNKVFSEIRDTKVKELFSIFIDNRTDCEVFTILTDEKMKEIEGVKKYLLESKIDQYNKNNEFITIKFPKMLESTRKYTEFRKKLICGGL